MKSEELRQFVRGWAKFGLGCLAFCAAVVGFAAESISITATPRYPWNGKVDLKFTIDGTSGTKYDTSFTAKDVAGGTNLTMKTLYKSDGTAANVAKEQLLPGTYNWVWDATADLGEGTVLEKVVVEGKTQEKLPPIISGLVAYWSFDGDINDHSGNAHDLSGTAPSWVTDRLGNAGKAASFSGSLTLSQKTNLGVTKSMTFACWAKPGIALNFPSYASYNLGVGNYWIENRAFPIVMLPPSGTDSNNGIGFSIATDRVDVQDFASGKTGMKGDPGILMDCAVDLSSGWHHIAITINNNGAPALYVDGVAQSVRSTSISGTSYISKASTIGGGSFSNSVKYKGGLDEFCIYNRALSAAEVKQLYQAK